MTQETDRDPYLSATAALIDRVGELKAAARPIGAEGLVQDLSRAAGDLDNAVHAVNRAHKRRRELPESDRYRKLPSAEARQRARDDEQQRLDDTWTEMQEVMHAAGTVAPSLAAKVRRHAEAKLAPNTDVTDSGWARAESELSMMFKPVSQGDSGGYQRTVDRVVERHGFDSPPVRLLQSSWGRSHAESFNVPDAVDGLTARATQYFRENGSDEQQAAANALDQFNDLQLDATGNNVRVISESYAANGPATPPTKGPMAVGTPDMTSDKITLTAKEQ